MLPLCDQAERRRIRYTIDKLSVQLEIPSCTIRDTQVIWKTQGIAPGGASLGKLIAFPARPRARGPLAPAGPEQGRQAAERALLRLLPAIAEAGLPELALDALVRWAEGSGDVHEVLDSVQTMATISGIRLPWTGTDSGLPEWYPS